MIWILIAVCVLLLYVVGGSVIHRLSLHSRNPVIRFLERARCVIADDDSTEP